MPSPTPKVLRYGATLPVDRIDPLSGSWNEPTSLIYSRPFTVTSDGELVPDLTTGFAVSADGLDVRLPIRTGVRWHDDSPFTPADLAGSLERVAGRPGGPLPAGLTVTDHDDFSVRLRLAAPAPALPHQLARVAVVRHGRSAADELDRPIGTGPYHLVERTPGIARFRRHEEFHLGAGWFDEVDLIHHAEDEDRARAVAAGAVDLAQVKPQHLDLLAGRATVHRLRTRVWRALSFNTARPVGADRSVRRALAALIDRDLVVQQALDGFGRPQYWPTPPSSWATPVVRPEHGADAAGRELVLGGWHRTSDGWSKDGQALALTLGHLRTETFRTRASQALAGTFEAFGIPVTLAPVEWDEYHRIDSEGIETSSYDGMVVGWSGGVDPYDNLAVRYGTGGRYTPAGHTDPEFDAVLDAASNAPDRKTAVELYRRANELSQRDAVMIPLVNPDYLFAARPDLGGFETAELDSFYEFTAYAHLFRPVTP